MIDAFTDTVASGSLMLAIPIAVLAGLVSFFSPCVIPLVPAYFSYTTGLSGADLAAGDVRRGRMFAGASLFVLGFTVVFVILGAVAGSLRRWLVVNDDALYLGLGVLTILLGLAFLGALPLFRREFRIHKVPSVGLAAAPVLGFLFGLGWTPCIGPTLSMILGLAYGETATRAALLLGFYSIGLGVPFVIFALLWRRALGALAFVRRHQAWVTRAGGVMMIVMGILLVSGLWAQAVAWMQVQFITDFEVAI